MTQTGDSRGGGAILLSKRMDQGGAMWAGGRYEGARWNARACVPFDSWPRGKPGPGGLCLVRPISIPMMRNIPPAHGARVASGGGEKPGGFWP
jgi:hypothetical protein